MSGGGCGCGKTLFGGKSTRRYRNRRARKTRKLRGGNTNVSASMVFYADIGNEIHVLVGKETQYLSDLQHEKYIRNTNFEEIYLTMQITNLEEIETVSASAIGGNKEDAEHMFREHTLFLNENFKLRGQHNSLKILYEPIKEKDGMFTTKYRFIPQKNNQNQKYGIVKGGCEGEENPEQCIIREVEEEVMLNIDDPNDIEYLDYVNVKFAGGRNEGVYVYSYEIKDPDSFIDMLNTMNKVQKRGEMYDFQFIPLQNYNQYSYNRKSLYSLKLFNRKKKLSNSSSKKK